MWWRTRDRRVRAASRTWDWATKHRPPRRPRCAACWCTRFGRRPRARVRRCSAACSPWARAARRTLTVFQNRRWDPDFVALQRVVREGAVGDLFYMESFVGGYRHPCSLWHSHEPISGGAVYDWGSHYIDWTLQLFDGPVTAVR